MLKGFKDFIMRGNVIDLAVAVVIGAAFKSVVDAFVANIITPLIAAIAGKQDFSKLFFTWHKSQFNYGSFINAVITFVLVAAAIYFFVVLPLNTLAERRARKLESGVPDEDPKPEDIALLEQIRDLLKAQQH
jgi:large conductance mechanosensitive channel